ncbi:MAG: hypothetical protein R2939_22620 [Kofleriaceae bacterium]
MGKLAQRDDQVGRISEQMVAMSKELSSMRAELARQAASCGQPAAVPTTIIQTVDAKGSKYGRRDVEPMLTRARTNMSKKGLLAADLPGPAQGLEKEATAAMADADFGKAYFAASQLLATVDSIKIDRAFIGAKIGRLSARMKGRTLEAGAQAQVDGLFREATEKYGDGDFGGANKRLNQIASLI